MKKLYYKYAATFSLLTATVFEVLVLVYFNIFRVKTAVDQDYAQLLYHAMQMADNNKLLLTNWFYSTTAELDCPMLLAVLFYKAFGDIYYAFALSNLINIALWILTINVLMENVGASLNSKLVAMCLVFATYDFSVLAYTNMMFIRGSQYTMKVLIPIMFTTVLTFPRDKQKSGISIFLNVMFYILAFITSFSSGIYVFLCGIAPIIVCIFFYYIFNKCNNKKFYLCHVAAVAGVTVLGLFLQSAANLTDKSDGFMVRNDITIVEAFFNSISDVFWALRMFPDYPVPVNSPEAIGIVLRWMVIALVCFGFISVKKAFAIEYFGKENTGVNNREFATTALISVFVFTVLLLTLIPSRIRYQLIGIIPLMLVASLNIENWAKGLLENYRAVFYSACGVLFIANSIFSLNVDARLWLNGEKSLYQVNYEVNGEIKRILDENGADVAYVYENNQLRAGLTLTDPDRHYKTVVSSGEVWIGWDNYVDIDRRENPDFGNKNAIILGPHEDETPGYITDNYRLIGNVDEYEIYYSDYNPIEN